MDNDIQKAFNKGYEAALSHSKERIAELEKDAAMKESK